MENLTNTINKFAKQGYTNNLIVREGELLTEDRQKLDLGKTKVDFTSRVEAGSDPDHQSIVYAISNSEKNVRGLLISSFGTYSDGEKQDIVERIEAN